MTLSERIAELVRACFPGLWIESHEHDDAVAELARLCRTEGWSLATWDLDRGLERPGSDAAGVPGAADPLAALKALDRLAAPDGTALLVLRNYHRFLASPEVVQALDTALAAGKERRGFVVILAPLVQLPVELERQFIVVEHELPGREQLRGIASGVATEPGERPDGPELEAVLDAAAGLTRLEAEGAFALSLVRHGRLEPRPLWELKAQALRKAGLLTLHRGAESFDGLGGLEALKAFCLCALRPSDRPGRPRARGILLLGVPGTGKTGVCKALGNETGRPTVVLDVGALKGSLVGLTEERTRKALAQVDRMAPCICLVDEVEKALAGVQSSGVSDSGVTAGLFGTLLSWLNDRESDVFFVATCNDISKLPPEFSRAERFDGIFFLDLPGRAEKDAIWRIYLEKYGLDPEQRLPRDQDFTGAEIKSCCRLAALLEISLLEAAQNVVPVAVTAGEAVERLRSWASGRCLSADRPGLYTRAGSGPSRPGRNVARSPSEN